MSNQSKTEENLAKLKANMATEAMMKERWLKAREKVEEKILRKKKEARGKEAAEAKHIADEEATKTEAKRIADEKVVPKEVKQIINETEAEKAATSVIFGWLKIFLTTALGAGMLYALWWKYCRPKIGSDAT